MSVAHPTTSNLSVRYYFLGMIPLTEALVVQSVITLAFLFMFALVDLMVLHWLAFNKQSWAIFAYRVNTIFAPLPFVLGTGTVLVFSAANVLPLELANSLLTKVSNPLIMLSFALFISGVTFIEQGRTTERSLRSNLGIFAIGTAPYIVFVVVVWLVSTGWR